MIGHSRLICMSMLYLLIQHTLQWNDWIRSDDLWLQAMWGQLLRYVSRHWVTPRQGACDAQVPIQYTICWSVSPPADWPQHFQILPSQVLFDSLAYSISLRLQVPLHPPSTRTLAAVFYLVPNLTLNRIAYLGKKDDITKTHCSLLW